MRLNHLIDKAKATHANTGEQGLHSLLPICRQMFIHPQDSRTLLCVTVTWED